MSYSWQDSTHKGHCCATLGFKIEIQVPSPWLSQYSRVACCVSCDINNLCHLPTCMFDHGLYVLLQCSTLTLHFFLGSVFSLLPCTSNLISPFLSPTPHPPTPPTQLSCFAFLSLSLSFYSLLLCYIPFSVEKGGGQGRGRGKKRKGELELQRREGEGKGGRRAPSFMRMPSAGSAERRTPA